jgi:hypothetical protein
MKLNLKVSGNPVEVDIDSIPMGIMMDHEKQIRVLLGSWENVTPDESRQRIKMTSEIIAKAIAEQYPDLQWEGIQRALPYNRIIPIFSKLIVPDVAGNGESPSTTTGANASSN